MQARNRRDFWAGVMFFIAGLLFMGLSQQYTVGTAAKMGPGYFPTVLGGLMALLGVIVLLGAYGKQAAKLAVERIQFRPIVLVLAAVVLFGFLLPRLGMVLSLVTLVVVSAIASHEFRLRDTLLSIVVLAALSYVVFVKGLELQFPVWPTFLTQ